MERLERHRAAVEEALAAPGAEIDESRLLIGPLDAFGDRVEVQGLGQPEDSQHDGPAVPGAEFADERPVDDPWNGRRRIASGIFTSVAVELGGINAAVGVLAALLEARATGRGTWIEVSCWDAAVEATRLRLAHLVATGSDLFDVRELGPLYDVYRTGDGKLLLFGALERKFWERFCAGVERPHLSSRWKGGGGAVQFEGDDELRRALDAIFAEHPAAEWIERLIAWEVPVAEILRPDEVLEHPHFRARDLIDDLGPGPVDPRSGGVRRDAGPTGNRCSPEPGAR